MPLAISLNILRSRAPRPIDSGYCATVSGRPIPGVGERQYFRFALGSLVWITR